MYSRGTLPTYLLEKLSWTDKVPFVLAFGCLLGLSSPGFGMWWLAWIGLVPLIVLTRGCLKYGEAMLTGLLFGMAYHLVCLNWLLQPRLIEGLAQNSWQSLAVIVGFWFLIAFCQALLFSVFAVFIFVLPMRAGFLPHYQRPFIPSLLALPLIWVFLQWIIIPSEQCLRFPMNQLAYSQSVLPQLIQMAKVGGAQLIDFILVLFNATVAALALEFSYLAKQNATRSDFFSPRTGAIFDLLLIACVIVALTVWGRGEILRSCVAPPYWQKGKKSNFAPAVTIAILQGSIVPKLGVSLLVLPPGVEKPGSERVSEDMLKSRLQHIVSSERKEAIIASPDGIRVLGPNTTQKVSIWGQLATCAAQEITCQAFIARQVSKGAALIVNVADLSVFHSPLFNQQLLAAAVMRAVENTRYVILAVNSGFSVVIDPCGIVTSMAISEKQGVLVDRVQFLYQKAPFTRMWWLWTPLFRR